MVKLLATLLKSIRGMIVNTSSLSKMFLGGKEKKEGCVGVEMKKKDRLKEYKELLDWFDKYVEKELRNKQLSQAGEKFVKFLRNTILEKIERIEEIRRISK